MVYNHMTTEINDTSYSTKPKRPGNISKYINLEKLLSFPPYVRKQLHTDCRNLVKPDKYIDFDPVINIDSLLAFISNPEILHHSISVGLIFGAFCQRFFDIPMLDGFICGLAHDLGKSQIIDLIKIKGLYSPQQREVVKDHVYYTALYLQDDYPTLTRLVIGHHLYGQPDKHPYPENYTEENGFMESLQIALAVADKISASVEFRPELSDEQVADLFALQGMVTRCNRLYEWFSPWPQAKEFIDYAIETLQSKVVIDKEKGKIKIPGDVVGVNKKTITKQQVQFTILGAPYQGRKFVDILLPLLLNRNAKITFDRCKPNELYSRW